ncbi:probable protein phosphatase 2C 72 isoform X2 [Chenopodium quinoa]|uniref:PPM-type phosphatase domain-containing protein n=1 Tax=Chenopodium quinoa TaxID=63459 RepID=A0A803LBE3_CHEQI|nr:probable protein phosphatase 2C 72 isoform X2 [Chenopodium quinoa]
MGINLSTSSIPDNTEGLGNVIYDQNGLDYNNQIKSGLSVYTKRGGKAVNQDCAVLCQGYESENGVLCGVFDGHGIDGHLVSKDVSRRLPLLILKQKIAMSVPQTRSNSKSDQTTNLGCSSLNNSKELLTWKEACIKAFQEMDDEVLKKVLSERRDFFSGSTAVVALKQSDDLLIANLGDSRAILGCRGEKGVTAVQLTTDLTPGIPDEADRIRRFNGRVLAMKNEPHVKRAWLPLIDRPGLAMSRSFGEVLMKKCGIISTPVITHHHITPNDLFILLASDGIWDVLSNEEVASVVWGVQQEEMAAKAVIDAAVVAWKKKFRFDKRDDCTVVCYFLQKKGQSHQTSANPPLETKLP